MPDYNKAPRLLPPLPNDPTVRVNLPMPASLHAIVKETKIEENADSMSQMFLSLFALAHPEKWAAYQKKYQEIKNGNVPNDK